ncbi:uncharacterized protein LOC121389337 [Gigantopelta aegis]|uniref:uncharacterized protein LOC121389337 n=1 Tax=Gigantopelta aegis TaxID=1735272 RepID=UPI001B88A318|nr:uncharacterized protein LOC121389337 [Gigantopelta aegis]
MSGIVDLKKQLKKWEASFFLEHSRKPNKTDIDASGNIKEIYEQYSKLKRQKNEVHVQDKTESNSSLSDLNKCETDTKSDDEKTCNQPDSSTSIKSPPTGSCNKLVSSSSNKSLLSSDICSEPVSSRSSKSPSSNVCNEPVSSRSSKLSPAPSETSTGMGVDETDGSSSHILTPEDIWGPALNKDLSVSESHGEKSKEKKEVKSSSLLDKLGQKLFKNEQKLSMPDRNKVFGSRRRNRSKPKVETGCLRSENNVNFGTLSTSSDPIKTTISDHDKTEVNQSKHSLHISKELLENEKTGLLKNSGCAMTTDDNSKPRFSCKSSLKISSVYNKKVSQNFEDKDKSVNDDVVIPKHFQLGKKPHFNFNKKPVQSIEELDSFDQNLELEDQIREESQKLSIQEDPANDHKLTDYTESTVSGLKKKCLKKSPNMLKSSEKPTRQRNRSEKKSATSYCSTENLNKNKTSGQESGTGVDINETGINNKTGKKQVSDDVSERGDAVFDASNIGKCDSEEDEVLVKRKPSARKRKLTGTADSANKKLKQNPEETEAASVNNDYVGSEPVAVSKKSRPLSAAPRKKAASADNFVRLNMKVKRYIRKDGRHLSGPQYKRKQWKDKMKARSKSYGDKCFICNKEGHWSRDCPDKKGGKQMKNSERVEENDFPSILEAAGMSRGNPATVISESNKDGQLDSVMETDQDEMIQVEMSIVRSHREVVIPRSSVQPLLTLTPDGKIPENVPEIYKGLKMFGFDEFRPGQEQTVKRILAGLSTLVVLSTGGGKSLCYQLPAYLYGKRSKSLTVVVSPLVSLMEDQVTGLPAGVRGVCLHSNMTQSQREGVFAALNDGSVHFLLVSPEAVVGGGGMRNASFPPPDKLPPIPFVCIDEAHCLSEWSHNFRPSYLRLCKVLRERYGVKCFLGLTATATKATAYDVSRHLGIEDVKEATIRGSPIPKNLILSVSQDENRDEALMNLLQGERFTECDSIIVYCTRREEVNRVATLLRTCLQKPEMDLGVPLSKPIPKKGKKGRRKKSLDAESYHAGLTPAHRKRVQKDFMSGHLRIVVATVAFGMGLDKADVRAIIHYNMPKSFEGYVQEIGRAGRDGKTSHCHVFLDSEISGYPEIGTGTDFWLFRDRHPDRFLAIQRSAPGQISGYSEIGTGTDMLEALVVC